MSAPFDYLVFIGRFQPFHNGHRAVVARALTLAKHVVILIGSANAPRTIRNPWTAAERESMIRATFAEQADRLIIRPLRDHPCDDASWMSEVQRHVAECIDGNPFMARVGLIGHRKDRSSYYLGMFPQWELVESDNVAGVSATAVRDHLFDLTCAPHKELLIRAAVPTPVLGMLKSFREGPQFARLERKHHLVHAYRGKLARAVCASQAPGTNDR